MLTTWSIIVRCKKLAGDSLSSAKYFHPAFCAKRLFRYKQEVVLLATLGEDVLVVEEHRAVD